MISPIVFGTNFSSFASQAVPSNFEIGKSHMRARVMRFLTRGPVYYLEFESFSCSVCPMRATFV